MHVHLPGAGRFDTSALRGGRLSHLAGIDRYVDVFEVGVDVQGFGARFTGPVAGLLHPAVRYARIDPQVGVDPDGARANRARANTPSRVAMVSAAASKSGLCT